MKRSPLKRKTPLRAKSPMKKRRSQRARAKEFSLDIRWTIYDRTGGMCEMCKARPIAHLHHAIFRSQGGTGDLNNALGVCIQCHELCHSSREARGRAVRLAKQLAGGHEA